MSDPLQLPLPADVDVSDMPHMPLLDNVLMKSRAWLRAKNWRGGGPGLGFCLMNLWTAAFRSVPGGSLDDEDDMLSDVARCDISFWLEVKDSALVGWERHGGRIWHPKVAELAWDLWRARLEARYSNAFDSWRNAAKRATEKGREPPAPPGDFNAWLEAKFPATAAYICGHCPQDKPPKQPDEGNLSVGRPADNGGNPSDFDPKRSKGKVITPHLPPTGPGVPTANGQDGQVGNSGNADGKAWFARELGRLEREFGPAMVRQMMANMQRPGVSGRFVLVQVFKGSWLQRGHGNRPEILMPSKVRADAVIAAHGEWMRVLLPDLHIRHATTDEKRANKGRVRV